LRRGGELDAHLIRPRRSPLHAGGDAIRLDREIGDSAEIPSALDDFVSAEPALDVFQGVGMDEAGGGHQGSDGVCGEERNSSGTLTNPPRPLYSSSPKR